MMKLPTMIISISLLCLMMMKTRPVGSTSSPMVRRFMLKTAIDTKEKTINGKKYAFDQYGAMVAEWSLDEEDLQGKSQHPTLMLSNRRRSCRNSQPSDIMTGKAFNAKYSEAWRYFNSVEDGARVSKGWFKVVAAEYLNDEKYNDDEDCLVLRRRKRQSVCRRVQDHQRQEVCVPQ